MALTLYKFSNPYASDSDKKYFTINNKFITITQNKSNGIGWTFWDCVKNLLLIVKYFLSESEA